MRQALPILCALFLPLSVGAQALSPTPTPAPRKNFAYSQNPKTRPQPETREVKAETIPSPEPAAPVSDEPRIARNETTIAEKTREVAKNAARRSLPPTETYTVGAGDVLFVSLQNNPKASTYFTVLNDGTIDYPLAGEMVPVGGLTTDEVEEILASKIKLYESPLVSVRVREYNSHRVTVIGLVENAGERSIQREAVPLFVVRADAVVQPAADSVSVKRAGRPVERYELKDAEWENVLVFPGDIVEFASRAKSEATNGFVYLSGEVAVIGRLQFSDGLTLSQALIVAGGAKKGARKATLRRRNATGMLESTEFSLRAINDGKAPDPVLFAGDIIEIGN